MPETTPADGQPSSASTPVSSVTNTRDDLANQSTSRGVWGPYSNGNKSTINASGSGLLASNEDKGGRDSPSSLKHLNSSSTPKSLTPARLPAANLLKAKISTPSTTASTLPSSGKAPNGFPPTAAGGGQALPKNNAPPPLPHKLQSTGDVQRDVQRNRTGFASGGPPPPRPDPSRASQASNAQGATHPTGTSNPAAIKMKRTGQNFPLHSSSTSHQRKGSNSPIPRSGSVSGAGVGAGGGQLRRAPDTVPTKFAAPSVTRQTPVPVPKIPSNRQEGPTSSKTIGPSRNGVTAAKSNRSVPDSDSDDIMYEANAPTDAMYTTGRAVDAASDYASSSGDSDSQSEDDDDDDDDDDDVEAVERDFESEVSLRQRFQAPDQEEAEDDEDDSDDETEDDDAISVSSSSGDSSIANEPAVDLPSAGIRHQELFPSTILDMAEPDRPYSRFLDKGVTIKAAPAIFPVGYAKGNIPGFPWVCAVRSCRQCYKNPAGIANHARFTHKKAMFNDNMDGTVSLVGSYSQRNAAGHYPPVVVSRRPLDPKEPPMREPCLPPNKIKTGKAKSNAVIVVKENVNMVVDGADALEPQAPPSRPQTAERERSEQMWRYIQPYLSVHTSMPELNWARYIAHLPRVRDVTWNEERAKDHPYKDSHGRDVTALIVQVTGVESPIPCQQCAQGRGPFIGCIQISPDAPDEAKGAVLSCANCYYHCGQSACSHCVEQVIRRKRDGGPAGRYRPGEKHVKSYNMKFLTDEAHGKASRATAAQAQSGPASSPVETPVKRNLKLYHPSEFTVIEQASAERSYYVVKNKDGGDVRMHGALIPEKYDLDHTVAGYPWICSVRSCRKVFKKGTSLGTHFIKAHPGTLLNDNLDGTLSQVGYYNIARPGVNGLPPLVISKRPLDPDEPPMEQPTRPGYFAQVPQVVKSKRIAKTTLPAVRDMPLARRQHWKPLRNELWDHILPYLPDTVLTITEDPRVLALLGLQRQRHFQLRPGFKVDDDHKQLVAAIIYVTGEEHQNGLRKCTLCAKGAGPFPHCITLKKKVPIEARTMVRSCANCIFTHQKNQCSVKGWKFEPEEGELAAPPGAVWTTPGANKRSRIADSESEEPLAIRRRSDRLGVADEGVTMDSEPRRNGVPSHLVPNRRSMPQMSGLLRGGDSGGVVQTKSSSALVQAGHFDSDDMLEMEDWEIAPGRIRATGATGPDNFAFSKSYLESNQAVRVSRDVTVEVKTIKSGNSIELAADPTRTRYCHLSTGKLHVTIVGVDDIKPVEEFSIGPLGLIKIVPGMTARMLNKLYVEVTLTINSIAH